MTGFLPHKFDGFLPAEGLVDKASLKATGEFPCPYLPSQVASNLVLEAERIDPESYHQLMNLGFRRSGDAIYRPVCPRCSACRPLRIEAERFVPDKSQRRCWKRNQDLQVQVRRPELSDEKYDLYQRYIQQCHDGTGIEYDNFTQFLYQSPVNTVEFTYRDASGRLLGVGICDQSESSLSSVYFYRDPTLAQRGLGTFSALWEISYALRSGIPYYYFGFWVKGCRKMEYKAKFYPHEVLDTDGRWIERQRAVNERRLD